jgi:hypothetical protein
LLYVDPDSRRNWGAWPIGITNQKCHPAVRYLKDATMRTRDGAETAKHDALKDAARKGFRDIEEGRYRDVRDSDIAEFITTLGRQASAKIHGQARGSCHPGRLSK